MGAERRELEQRQAARGDVEERWREEATWDGRKNFFDSFFSLRIVECVLEIE
jgi:hypothetical protein